MNQLSYQLTPDYGELKQNELWLGLELFIDGKNPLMDKEDEFDIRELLLSFRPGQKAALFILTCSCGFPECAGYYHGVKVTVSDDKVEWLDQDQDFKYEFVKEAYFAKLRSLYKELCDWNYHAKSRRLQLRLFPDWHKAESVIEEGAYLGKEEC